MRRALRRGKYACELSIHADYIYVLRSISSSTTTRESENNLAGNHMTRYLDSQRKIICLKKIQNTTVSKDANHVRTHETALKLASLPDHKMAHRCVETSLV